jgi:hypothetical protein
MYRFTTVNTTAAQYILGVYAPSACRFYAAALSSEPVLRQALGPTPGVSPCRTPRIGHFSSTAIALALILADVYSVLA